METQGRHFYIEQQRIEVVKQKENVMLSTRVRANNWMAGVAELFVPIISNNQFKKNTFHYRICPVVDARSIANDTSLFLVAPAMEPYETSIRVGRHLHNA